MGNNINNEINYFFDYCEGNSFAIKKIQKIKNYILYLERTREILQSKIDEKDKRIKEEVNLNNKIIIELSAFQVKEIEKNEKMKEEKLLQ